jgi:hypothetical protein
MSWLGSRLSRIRDPEKSNARSKVESAVTRWLGVSTSAFFARPIRFSGLRAVEVADETATQAASAAMAREISIVDEQANSPSRRCSGEVLVFVLVFVFVWLLYYRELVASVMGVASLVCKRRVVGDVSDGGVKERKMETVLLSATVRQEGHSPVGRRKPALTHTRTAPGPLLEQQGRLGAQGEGVPKRQ